MEKTLPFSISAEKILLYGIRAGAALVLLMPLIVNDGSVFLLDNTLFPFIVGKALYARTLTEIIFGLWLILAFNYPSYRLPRSWLLVAFAVWLGVSLLAGIAGVSIQRSMWSTYERMQGIVDLFHWFLLAVVMTSVFRSMLSWRLLLNFNLGVSLVMALVGVAERYDRWPFEFYDFLEAGPRLDITLGNATYVGAYMLVNVFIGLALLSQSFRLSLAPEVSRTAQRRRRRRRARAEATGYSLVWWRLFWVTVIAMDLWMLWLSGTRGAFWIGLPAGLAAFGVGYIMWGRVMALRRASLYLVGGLAALGLIFVLVKDTAFVERLADRSVMAQRITTIGLDDGSVKGRLNSTKTGFLGYAARPVLGWGPENYIVAWGRYFDGDPGVRATFDQAHNKLMEELSTKGSIGFLSYIALWAIMLWVVSRAVRRQDAHEQLFTLFMGAALVGYFVQNLFLFDTPATALQFVLLLAFVAYLETTLHEPAADSARNPRQGPGDESGGSGESQAGSWRYRPNLDAGRGWLSVPEGTQGPGGVGAFGSKGLAMYGVIAVVLVLVGLSVYFLNYRPYTAAKVIVETANPNITWDERLGFFERSIDSFPVLANYPRLIMFSMLYANLDALGEDRAMALAFAEDEALRAIEAEPRGWRVYATLARLYQKAALQDPKFKERADSYLDKAAELAPNTIEVTSLRAELQALEEKRR